MTSSLKYLHAAFFAACITLVTKDSFAFASWDAGAASDNFNTAANWDDQGFEFVPGPESLAVHDNLGNTAVLPPILINANAGASAVDQSTFETVQGVDSLRLSHGGSVIHSAGTLNVTRDFSIDFFTQAIDRGLWVGEFGTRTFAGPSTSPSIYTLSGGVVDVKDTADSIQIGRSWNSTTQSDYGDGRFVMSGGTINSAGDATIGLDGHAEWTQTGGVYNGGNTFIGRFASPNSVVNLSGNTDWNLTGSLLVADQQTQVAFRVGRPDGAGVSQLNITGSQVGLDVSNGLFLRGNATLNYVADALGVSPIVVNGTTFELSDLNVPGNRPNLSVNLAALSSTNSDITLINAKSIAFGQFHGLPEGSTNPSFGNRTLTYRGGSDGFDVMLVNSATYVPPAPIPQPPDAVIGRWSMDNVQSQTPGAPFEGNPAVLDRATGANQGILPGNQGVNGNAANNVDHLWFFSADLNQDYQTSSEVPPVGMFANGNNGGTTSYNAAAVLDSFNEGALFFPQDIYGNEFSFDGTFSVEAFVKTSDGTSPQQVIVQGEGFNRYGVSMNDLPGAIRLSVNDGEREEFVDIGGSSGIGNANYGDGQWHYILATFEKGAGANGTGKLQINVANQDGTTATISKDLSASFLGLPPAFNDGNFLVGSVDFNGIGVTESGTIGPIPPKRFHGIIDEVQISRGIVPANQRLGVLNLTEPLNIGDYNNDGTVNAADYTVWRDSLGTVFALQNRDPASTGVISQADYLAWKNNFGTVGSAAAASAAGVPEPSSLLLGVLGVVAVGARIRRISRG